MRTKLSFADVYYDSWVKLLQQYGLFCDRIISQQVGHSTPQECIVSVGYFKGFSFGLVQNSVVFMDTFP